MCQADIAQRKYLFSILSTLTSSKMKPSDTLLLRHLDLASSFLSPGEQQATIKSHAGQYPTNPRLQRRYLQSLSASDPARLMDACEITAKAATTASASDGEAEDIRAIWMIWSDALIQSPGSKDTWDRILKLSQKLDPVNIFPTILARYFAASLDDSDPIRLLQIIASRYGPPASFYANVFGQLSQRSRSDLSRVYEMWSRACKAPQAKVEAAISWAGWLLEHRKAHEARRVVETVKSELGGLEAVALEGQWQALLDVQSDRHGADDAMEVQ